MRETTILLAATLLVLSASFVGLLSFTPPSPLPSLDEPLDESKVQVHWIKEGEPAPFDGILLNEYTYERLRLKIIELEGSQ